jgi:hypothetical protein
VLVFVLERLINTLLDADGESKAIPFPHPVPKLHPHALHLSRHRPSERRGFTTGC